MRGSLNSLFSSGSGHGNLPKGSEIIGAVWSMRHPCNPASDPSRFVVDPVISMKSCELSILILSIQLAGIS